MISLLTTVLTIFILLVQLSSSAAIKWNPSCDPWRPWTCWPAARHTNTPTLTLTVTSTSRLVPTTSTSAFPTSTTTSDEDDTCTFDSLTTTQVPSPSQSLDDGDDITTATILSGTSSSEDFTSAQVPTTFQTTTTTKSQSGTSATSTQAPVITSPSSSGGYWKPTAGVTWQIQISGTVDTSIQADIYDVDLFDTPVSTISTLHNAGRKVICYFSAGSYENWRSDQSSFQASDKGSAIQGWANEWWLNTNSANVRSIMTKRIEMASSKGCDGIDPDNVDGYANDNGLEIKEADAVDYLTFLSNEAHSRGLAIGLKNALGLIDTVLPIMQWAVNEQCEQFNECGLSKPFIDAGKPVLHIEYPDTAPNVSPDVKKEKCGVAAASRFSTVLKTMDLSAWVDPC